MVRFIKAVFIVTAAFMVISLLFVLLDPLNQQVRHRQDFRRQQVEEILNLFERHFAEYPRAFQDQFGPNFYHLGSAPDHCQLDTKHCSATTSACLDMHLPLRHVIGETTPADILIGNPERTYYAVQLGEGYNVTVKACGSETDEDIFATRNFSEIIREATRSGHFYATPSALPFASAGGTLVK